MTGPPAPRPSTTKTDRPTAQNLSDQESRVIAAFARHYGVTFRRSELLKLALTHRSYLSVTGQGPRESNERLEFLGDSVLGLVTSEFLYRAHPNEHEGQLTKTKSLLVSKAILSRRALAMGLGRFVLMSHSEVESGGRQRMSILADAFESVVGAIYIDLGFEAAREFIERWLLRDSREIVADKRHTNYKSHLQEYVQSTFRTHPVYRIRSQIGPDHSKQFNVEVMVSRRVLGSGQGRNKKEAEQAAARNALEQVEGPHQLRHPVASPPAAPRSAGTGAPADERELESDRGRRRGRRGGRGRRPNGAATPAPPAPEAERMPSVSGTTPEANERRPVPEPMAEPRSSRQLEPRRPKEVEPRRSREVEPPPPKELEPRPRALDEYEYEEVGRPEGPLEERHVDPFATIEETGSPSPARRDEFDALPVPDEEGAEAPSADSGFESGAEEAEPDPDSGDEESGSEPPLRSRGIPYGRRSGRSKRRPGPG